MSLTNSLLTTRPMATMSIAATGRAAVGPSPGRLVSASSNYPDM